MLTNQPWHTDLTFLSICWSEAMRISGSLSLQFARALECCFYYLRVKIQSRRLQFCTNPPYAACPRTQINLLGAQGNILTALQGRAFSSPAEASQACSSQCPLVSCLDALMKSKGAIWLSPVLSKGSHKEHAWHHARKHCIHTHKVCEEHLQNGHI